MLRHECPLFTPEISKTRRRAALNLRWSCDSRALRLTIVVPVANAARLRSEHFPLFASPTRAMWPRSTDMTRTRRSSCFANAGNVMLVSILCWLASGTAAEYWLCTASVRAITPRSPNAACLYDDIMRTVPSPAYATEVATARSSSRDQYDFLSRGFLASWVARSMLKCFEVRIWSTCSYRALLAAWRRSPSSRSHSWSQRPTAAAGVESADAAARDMPATIRESACLSFLRRVTASTEASNEAFRMSRTSSECSAKVRVQPSITTWNTDTSSLLDSGERLATSQNLRKRSGISRPIWRGQLAIPSTCTFSITVRSPATLRE
mmetsp:Transcript_40088/g.91454  ORF Transcript_40088/g.91454 Transcript_40088/m.91454 type:complete len:322 (-) Transcript_40088:889-1854(-)